MLPRIHAFFNADSLEIRNDEEAGLTSTRYKVNRVYNWFDREEMEDILAEGREE